MLKIPQKFLPLLMLEITTNSIYFFPCEEKDANTVFRTSNKEKC